MRFEPFEVRLRERRRHAPAHRCAPFYLCRRGAGVGGGGWGGLFITLCILIAREARGSRACMSCSVPFATSREQHGCPVLGSGADASGWSRRATARALPSLSFPAGDGPAAFLLGRLRGQGEDVPCPTRSRWFWAVAGTCAL